MTGDVDAACMIDAGRLAFAKEEALPSGSTRVLTQTGPYDHCNMTVLGDGGDPGVGVDVEPFGRLLLSMSYADPVVRLSTSRGSPVGNQAGPAGMPRWER